MALYLYANTHGIYGAPDTVVAFADREAVNAYLKAAYEMAVLNTTDKYHLEKLEGVETLDEFRKRVRDKCVSKSELWTTNHVAKDLQLARSEREKRKQEQEQRRLAVMKLLACYRDKNPVDRPI